MNRNENSKWLVITIVFLLIPVLINGLMSIPCRWSVQESNVWIGFWASYLGAMASFFMAFIAYKTLQNNSEQLDFMKAQNRPYVYPSIRNVLDDDFIYFYLLLENYGDDLANDVKISFEETSDGNNLSNILEKNISLINKSLFPLPSKRSKYFLIYKIPRGNNREAYDEQQKKEFDKIYNSLENAKYSIVLSYSWKYGNVDSKEIILDAKDSTIESTKIVQILNRINNNISKLVSQGNPSNQMDSSLANVSDK